MLRNSMLTWMSDYLFHIFNQGCQIWSHIGLDWNQMGKSGRIYKQKNYLKKSQICPIWRQN